MKLYINTTEDLSYHEGGCDEDHEHNYCDRGNNYYEFSVDDVFIDPERDCFGSAVDVPFDVQPGDTVYVLWVEYSDGDTFGLSYGRGTIVNVFQSYKEAKQEKSLIEDKDPKYTGYNFPWNGYFERLQSVHIESVTVKK